ncbi:MAG: cell wall hydrolase [Lachnospiraceae bacterium]|nr:cell wall hydrolase [Lachnospiraceae bacterium]
MHKENKISSVWEHVKLVGTMLFAMAAGVAAHHQYIVQRQEAEPMKADVVTIYEMEKMPTPAPTQQQEAVEQIEEDLMVQEVDLEEEKAADELELLAICVEAEAGNQGLTGKRMVADVILNRVDDPDFPDSIEGVISQKYAFTSFWDGGMDRVLEPSEETIRAVQMELEEIGWPGVIYFTADAWPEYGTPWKKVGNHYFSTK